MWFPYVTTFMNHSLDQKEMIFLGKLLVIGRMTFQQISILGGNRRKAQERLGNLKKQGLVAEENRDVWRRGQKLWFVLTDKGIKLLTQRTIDDLGELCSRLQIIITQAKPKQHRRWREAGHLHPSQEMFKRGYMTQDELGRHFEHQDRMFRPLRDVLYQVAKMQVKVEGPIYASEDLSNVSISFKDGIPVMGVVWPDFQQSNKLKEKGA